MSNQHHKDSDCTVDPDTNLCTVCGADHSQPCPECGRKAFHSTTCGLVDNGNTYSDRREKPEATPAQRELLTRMLAEGHEFDAMRDSLVYHNDGPLSRGEANDIVEAFLKG